MRGGIQRGPLFGGLSAVLAAGVLAAGLVAAGVLSVGPTQAQAPGPSFPLTVRGVLDSRSETSCSQSFASDTHRAELQLTVTRSGRATLTSDTLTRSRSGPSLGRYRTGDRDFSVVQSRERAVLTGRARRDGPSLRITFERLERAHARWSGEGELPLPAATSAPFSAEMRCTTTPTAVYPVQIAADEQPQTMDALVCTMESRPDGLTAFGPTWHFAPGAGLLTPWDETNLASDASQRVRRMP